MKFSGFNTTEKVGIANTAPAAKLHVGPAVYGPHSTISTIGIFADDVAGTAIPLTVSNANAVTVGDQARMSFSFSTGWSATSTIGAIIENTSTAATALSFETYKAGVGMIEAMRIMSDGNVGIGTTAPAKKLHVVGPDIVARLESSSVNSWLQMKGSTTHSWEIGTTSLGFQFYNDETAAHRVTFKNDGNVGIGTTTPLDKLHVQGNILQLDGSPEYHFGTISASHLNWRVACQEVVSQGFEIASGTASAGTSAPSDTYTNRFVIKGATGQIQFNSYGGGSHTGTSAYKLSVDSSGNIIETSIGSGAVDGAGTANYISKWTDSDTIGNSTIYDNGTDVGIGAIPTDPDQYPVALNVKGGNAAQGAVIYVGNTADENSLRLSNWGGQGYVTVRGAQPLYLGTSNATRVTVTAAGKVGIGTTAPGANLDSDTDTGWSGGWRDNLRLTSDLYPCIRFYSQTINKTSLIGNNNDGGLWFYVNGSGNATTSGSYAMVIQPDGNVGIGTTTPSALFHVYESSAGEKNWYMENAGSGPGQLNIKGGSGKYMSLARSGTVGTILVDGAFKIMNYSGGWNTSIYCTAAGDVGIGHSNVYYKLDVSGTFRATGQAYLNGGLRIGGSNANSAGERLFNMPAFANGVANQKIDLYWTGAFWGYMEIEITSSYSNQNASGILTKSFALGLNASNAIYSNESWYSNVGGVTNNNFAISGVTWDSTNSRYRIQIVHRTSTGNGMTLKMRCLGATASHTDTFMSGTTVSAVYTTDTTAFALPVVQLAAPNDNAWVDGYLGIGTATPDEKLEIYDGYLKITDAVPTMVFERQSDALKGYLTANVGYFQFSYNTKDGDGYIKMDVNSSGGSAITHEGNGYLRFGANNVSNQLVLAASGKVGIGTDAPGEKLHIAGTDAVIKLVDSAATSAGYVDFDGTALQLNTNRNPNTGAFADTSKSHAGIAMWGGNGGSTINCYTANANNTAGTSRIFIKADGNVGIGDTTPNRKLDVNGTFRVTGASDLDGAVICGSTLTINGNISNTADAAYYYLNNAGTGNSGVYIAGFSGDTMRCHVPANKYFEWEVGGAQKLKLDSAGLLTVAGAVKGTSHLVGSLTAALGIAGSFPDANDSELGPGYLVMTRDDTAAAKQLQFWKNGSLHSGLMTDTNGLNFVGSDGAADVTIDTNGKVGIGTTAPGKRLHVYSGASGIGASSDVNMILEGASNVGLAMLAPNNQGSRIEFGSVADNNEGIIYYNNTGSYFSIYTNGTRQVDITSDGNVGIGTATPSTNLDVNGTTRVGGVFSSEANYTSITEGLVAHYPLNEGTGDVSDRSKSAVGAKSLTNCSHTTIKGYACIDFPDTSNGEYINLGNPDELQFTSTGFTTSAWVHLDAGRDYGGIINKTNINGVYTYMCCVMADGRMSTYNGVSWYHSTAGDVPLGKWTLVTYSWDGTNLRQYANGVLKSTNAISFTNNTAHVVTIGSWYEVNSAYDIDGQIRDARIWNQGLSSQEVMALYKSTHNFNDHLYVDANTGYIGIGLAAPESTLHIRTSANHNYEFEEVSGELRLSALNDARSVNIPLQFAASEFNFMTGNVGIGTASPADELHVYGSGNIALFQSSSVNVWLQLKGSTTYSWQIGATGNGLQFYNDTTSSYRVTFKPDGKVGIGSATPIRQLDVLGAVAGQYSAALINTSTTGHGLYIKAAANSASYHALAVDDKDGNTLFTVRGDKKVGIGISAPNSKLEIEGFDSSTTLGTSVDVLIEGGGNTNKLVQLGMGWTSHSSGVKPPVVLAAKTINASGHTYADFIIANRESTAGGTAPVEHMRVTYDGNVGIGNAAPAYRLEVTGSATADWISKIHNTATTSTPSGLIVKTDYNSATATGGYLLGLLAGTDYRLVVQNDGNVGIGTITPEVTLTVRQTVQDSGIRLYGHSAHSGSYMNFRVDSSGHTNFETSGGSYTKFMIGSGYFLLQTGGGEPIYNDFGGTYFWRDVDASNAVRMQLDSASGNLAVTGNLTANGNTTLGNDDINDSWQYYGRNTNTQRTIKYISVSANGTQARSVDVCRLFFNVVHWGTYGDTTVELHDSYYGGDGYLKYACKAGNGNNCGIELVEASGDTSGMYALYGAAVDTGAVYAGYANYYVPVKVFCKAYRTVKVVVSTTRGIAAWTNTTGYSKLAFAPSLTYSNETIGTVVNRVDLNPTLSGGNTTTPNATSGLHSTRMQIQEAFRDDGAQILSNTGALLNITTLTTSSSIVQSGNGSTIDLGTANTGNGSPSIRFIGSNSTYNWRLRQNDNNGGDFTIKRSTAGGGTTFESVPTLQFLSDHTAIFRGDVKAGVGTLNTAMTPKFAVLDTKTVTNTTGDYYDNHVIIADLQAASSGNNYNDGRQMGLGFACSTASGGNPLTIASIRGVKVGTGNNHQIGELSFCTSGTPYWGMHERMRITYTGNVGIGTVTPEGTLHVSKSSAGGLGGQIVIDNPASSTVNNKTELSFLTDGGASGTNIRNARIVVATETASNGAANMQFHTWNGGAEGERMRISAAGTATFSGHVLPAANGTYNLGGSGNYWASCYFENTSINGTLYVGGVLTAASNVDVAQSKYLRVGGSLSTAPFSARQVSGSSMVHVMEINTGGAVQSWSLGLDTVGNYVDFVVQSEYGSGTWGERFRITKQYGCVGIGTDAPAAKLHVYGGGITLANDQVLSIGTTGGNNDKVRLYGDSTATFYVDWLGITSEREFKFQGMASAFPYITYFTNAGTGKHRIYANGYVRTSEYFWLSAAATPTSSSSQGKLYAYNNVGAMLYYKDGYNTAHALHSASDYRLKENVTNYSGSDACALIKGVNARRFDFISDTVPADQQNDRVGFLAHELQDAGCNFGGVVSGTKDEMMNDDEGNPVPKMQSVDYKALVPVLWSALQDALKRIETLENNH